MTATCPVCGLTGIPVCADGQLGAHAWYPRTAQYIDGPDDDEGNPTPGEWRGGCGNRELSAAKETKP